MPQGVELVGFCEMTNVAPVIYAWHEFITSRFGWPPDCPVNDGRLGQSGKAAFAPDRLQLARQITPFTYSYRLLHDQPLLPIAPPASGATARSHQPPVTYKRDNVHCRQIVPLGSSWIRSSRQFCETSSASKSRTATSIRRFSILARWRPKILTLAPCLRRDARHTQCWCTDMGPSGEQMVMHGASPRSSTTSGRAYRQIGDEVALSDLLP